MTLVLLVDDCRTFRDRADHVRCRNSSEGLAALRMLRREPGGELWLDHDLGKVADGEGGEVLDTVLPVLDELARAAFDGDPYPVSRVYVHTSNPDGAGTMMRVLNRWEYPVVRVVAGDYLIEETVLDELRTQDQLGGPGDQGAPRVRRQP